MELNWDCGSGAAAGNLPESAPVRRYSNDVASFWKLPEAWRPALATLISESQRQAQYYLYEEYLDEADRCPSRMLRYYYSVKPLIPPRVRHRLKSLAVKSRRQLSFPRWPCEEALLQLWRRALRASLERVGATDSWHVAFWPGGASTCIVLTHDVESAAGLRRMERMAELEERFGFRSAWNLPLEQYRIDWSLIESLRSAGFEFGAHGLRHDGRLFRSERDFSHLAPRLRALADAHALRGFRAPSTLRRAEWIPRLGFDFDSSFADTDLFEPQPGGTCSLFPFFLGETVELPYTLPQDHTLIHLLARRPLETWLQKARWIASRGGMILTLTHPDYSGSGTNLECYKELLSYLADIAAWRALPSEVAAWWRRRSLTELAIGADNRPFVAGSSNDAVARLVSSEPLQLWD